MAKLNKQDGTLQRNYLKKYLFLIREYELVKQKAHSQHKSVRDFYKANNTYAKSFLKYYNRYKKGGRSVDLLPQKRGPRYKNQGDISAHREAVFLILHSPPKNYGYNRTTWRMVDLEKELGNKGMSLAKKHIRKIIKDEGYRFLKARKVLTSNDPEYKEKLQIISSTLAHLQPNEKFFSIDEYGPFAIRIRGGRSLTPPGMHRTYPQFQKSKGCIILTAALELSTNQITHFYSQKKNTEEMLKLISLLVKKYPTEKRLFLSWDAASWHISKKILKKVNEINQNRERPLIKLMPLPACAQFLNVIESIFSGMARAIIHNSNYQSVEECEMAIDSYFKERNEYFMRNPKRAGKKLWGKERVEPVFRESNNCKDPKYLHNY